MIRLALLAALIAAPALAQAPAGADKCTGTLKAEDIVTCLKPAEPEIKTRGGLNLRGVTISKDVPAAPQKAPSVNLWINFAYNSADLTTDARIALEQLARALKDPSLSDKSFAIAGHTDAAGTAEYNRVLSEKRAVAVRDFLMKETGMSAQQLEAAGFGFSKLINTADPRAAENRRVEVTLIER